MSIKAESAWEINTVVVDLNGSELHLYTKPNTTPRFEHGTVTEGSMDLTLEEAKALLTSLTTAITSYEYMEKCIQENFEEKP